MPTIEVLAPNLTQVTVAGITFFFSYTACIAFKVNGVFTASENIWSRSTAKHFNEIGAKDVPRVPYNDFLDLLNDIKIVLK